MALERMTPARCTERETGASLFKDDAFYNGCNSQDPAQMRTRKTLLCRVNAGCYGDINARRTLRVSAHCYRNGIVTHRIDTAKLLISGAPEEIRTPDPQIRSQR
jgi:hypothetical protein